ncbi:MAG: carboxymuconolactone decarboxylase family protein [Trueperaceae bacterium]|nr:carboxymuconolactone decarboxylase family protein [Trueperaceae bacterium]
MSAGDRGDDHPARALWGEDAARIEAALREVDPDLADLILNIAYGRVFARPGLDHRTRSLLAIAHLMHVGHEDEIRTHVRALLRNGGSYDEAKETILHAAMFAGFPRALTAMRALARERDREGARDDDEGGQSDP